MGGRLRTTFSFSIPLFYEPHQFEFHTSIMISNLESDKDSLLHPTYKKTVRLLPFICFVLFITFQYSCTLWKLLLDGELSLRTNAFVEFRIFEEPSSKRFISVCITLIWIQKIYWQYSLCSATLILKCFTEITRPKFLFSKEKFYTCNIKFCFHLVGCFREIAIKKKPNFNTIGNSLKCFSKLLTKQLITSSIFSFLYILQITIDLDIYY